jgi:hypothetical protein
MATTTPNQGLPVPQSTDDPNIVEDLTNLALAIEKKLVMAFTNASDRSSRVPSPAEGMFAFMKDTNEFHVFDGSEWTPAIPAMPVFSSGTTVPPNTSGDDGDVFFQVEV